MRTTINFALVSCLVIGCSQPSGNGNTSQQPTSSPPAGVTAAVVATTPPDLVATVLGRPVKRSDCLSPSLGIGSVDVGIHILVLGLLTEDFSKTQSITLTNDEIDAFWRALRAAAQRVSPDPSKPTPEP